MVLIGIIHSSHAIAIVVKISITPNTVTMLAKNKCMLVCSSVFIFSQAPLQPFLTIPVAHMFFEVIDSPKADGV